MRAPSGPFALAPDAIADETVTVPGVSTTLEPPTSTRNAMTGASLGFEWARRRFQSLHPLVGELDARP
jgi:hypothetical protein